MTNNVLTKTYTYPIEHRKSAVYAYESLLLEGYQCDLEKTNDSFVITAKKELSE